MSSKKEDDKEKPDKNGSSAASGTSSKTNPIERLTSYLKDSLHLSQNDPDLKVLSKPTVDGIVEYILSGECKHIITMVGAGISTSAGIPDFRSPGSGLYDNLQKYDLPHPEAIFSLDYFHNNAKPFFELAKDLYPGTFKPSKTHYFIKMLADKGLLLRHYTQNIDTLERITGLENDILVEAHGTFHTGHCLGCRKEYSQDWMKERIFDDEIPICEHCPGVVKPDIVFFGENLPRKFFKCSSTDFKKCDLLIVMGSSLAVQPFASLADRVSASCPRVLINLELAGDFKIGKKYNFRDVGMIGDCDIQCQLLADKLGWGDKLKELVKTEHARIDKQTKKNRL